MRIDPGPQGRYLLAFDTRDLPRYATDVLVVGGGIAGLGAALAAARHTRVLLLMKDTPDFSNTAYAQGGIAAAVGPHDDVEEHAEDTLRTGCGLCDPAVVCAVTQGAAGAVEMLSSLGVRFDRDESTGGFAFGREGGHGKPRILHARGDATGAECSRALWDAVQSEPNIHILTPSIMLDLLTEDGRCVGALAHRHQGDPFVVFARTTVLAAGGAGRLFRETSNVHGATGDGIAAAYRAGAELRDLEFVQFHPTTLYLAGSNRELVTEAVRGEGAHLIDNHGERFVHAYHPEAELAPRDVVSQAIVDHLGKEGVTGVFLDLRDWPEGLAGRRFPSLARTCHRYGIDPEREPIPVRPAAHYFIGGVAAGLDGRTSLPGLFACGEAACTGLHGANRLASNSLLEGIVLGPRAGDAAAREDGPRFEGDLRHEAGREARRRRVDIQDLQRSVISRMWRAVGILRDAEGLTEAAGALARWRHFSARLRLYRRGAFELENLLLLGSLVTASALAREESRGTHARRDHPERDDTCFLGRFVWRTGADVEFRPLGGHAHG